MKNSKLEVAEKPVQDDERVLDEGLTRFNDAMGSGGDVRRLVVIDRQAGSLIGGLIGRTSGEMFEVQILWVDETHRG
ncbi:MAG: hypothetical protein KDB53_04620 [Planctomycetes bacterium]|nr:hypothetical protein [Planctomycetota bacterium]